MDSGDEYYWVLEQGKTYGLRNHAPYIGGEMKVTFFDNANDFIYFKHIELSIASPIPAAFTFSNLAINPRDAKTGETITISITVENIGEETGDTQVDLKLNGVLEQVKTTTVASGEIKQVDFDVAKSNQGVNASNPRSNLIGLTLFPHHIL